MEFQVLAKSYDSHGAHITLSHIGDFLLIDAANFGDAIKEICITLWFPDSGPAKKTLEDLLEQHQRYRASLPKVTYRKSKSLLEIEIASELMNGRDWKPSNKLSLSLFERGVEEICQALVLMRKRLKHSDDFDVDAFLNHCETAKKNTPKSLHALQEILTEIDARQQAMLDASSPWEILDIDWDCFHPQARDVLDNPFFWDYCDDFAPHGNDSGADVLEAYQDWIKKRQDHNPIKLLEQLAKQWGYRTFSAMDDDMRAEVTIGLAFAEIKVKAKCNDELRQLALAALECQRNQAEAATDWDHKVDRIKSLDLIDNKLRSL